MGSWDSAESTDLVGLFLLSKMRILNVNVGLYRDDGLLCSRARPRQLEKLKKDICKIFSDVGLKLEIIANIKVVNFLDITLDLNTGKYTPYMKENNTIRYIHTKSNHPPSVIKNIPASINNRLTRNSANSDIFDSSTQPYKDALSASGYDCDLKFDESVKQQQKQQVKKKNRSRNITWFNPPFSLNVKTNIGKIFLQLIKECFPRNHILHKICNRNTLKISYRTMPNMGRHISKHNNQILQQKLVEKNPGLREVPNCNCRGAERRANCPLPGQCNVSNVVYRCHVSTPDGNTETYTGCTKDFKTRCQAHIRSVSVSVCYCLFL